MGSGGVGFRVVGPTLSEGLGEVATGAQIDMRLRKDAGSVVRLDAERHGRTGRVKLSLLDLPVRPDQLVELIPSDLRQKLRREIDD